MRVLASVILTLSVVSVTSSARAQTYDPNYPVCLKLIQTFGGEWNDCRFTSLEQCAPAASGLAAQCIITIMRAQQGLSDATGVTAAPIELTATYVREGGKMIRMQTALPK